ncbi:uncharacterized protein C20orf173 homolog [Saccopteryx leptura]|uniref:uncharacterized protein C20orf173 homolog n=1 Tax=Saccopteryx leptura TaxID=249018 RepID=UPI00339C0026
MRGWEEVWCGRLGAIEANRTGLWGCCSLISLLSLTQVEKPVCCLPQKPSPGQDMKQMWQIFVLQFFWVLILCLTVPCLDWKPELAPQEKPMYLVPWHGNCLWFELRKCGCPSGILNCSLCHHTVRDAWCFDACYEKTMGYLVETTESMTRDAVLWWLGFNSASELGKVWEKLFKEILNPSLSHNDLHCGTCMLVGNSKILQASGLGNNVTQHTTVFRQVLRRGQGEGRSRPAPRVLSFSVLLPRMNQAPVQGFEMVENQTMGRFTCHSNAGAYGPWRQLLLLLLKLSGLAWTSDALSQEILEEDLVP